MITLAPFNSYDLEDDFVCMTLTFLFMVLSRDVDHWEKRAGCTCFDVFYLASFPNRLEPLTRRLK